MLPNNNIINPISNEVEANKATSKASGATSTKQNA